MFWRLAVVASLLAYTAVLYRTEYKVQINRSLKPNRLSPVYRHAAFFVGADGYFTKQSIADGHRRLQLETITTPIKCIAIINMLLNNNLTLTVDDLMRMVNPSRTGIWTADGEFDEAVFQKLVAEVGADGSVDRQQMDRLRNATNAYAVPIFGLPLAWSTITDGSLSELFAWLGMPNGRVRVFWLRKFYTDPLQTFYIRIQFIADGNWRTYGYNL